MRAKNSVTDSGWRSCGVMSLKLDTKKHPQHVLGSEEKVGGDETKGKGQRGRERSGEEREKEVRKSEKKGQRDGFVVEVVWSDVVEVRYQKAPATCFRKRGGGGR